MVLPTTKVASSKSVLDDKAFKESSNDSNFDVDMYLNDEEYNGDNVVLPQTPSEEVNSNHGFLGVYSEGGIPYVVTLPYESRSLCISVEIHDIPLQGRSSFARCLIEIKDDDVLKEIITMDILLLDGSGFSKETVRVKYEKKNGKSGCNSNSTNRNGVNISGQLVKSNVKYVPKAAVNVPKTRASNVVNTSKTGSSNAPTIMKNKPPKASVLPASSSGSPNGMNGGITLNIPASNPYVALNEESEEDVENVFDKSINLLSSAKTRTCTSTYTVSDG
ncbi:hypothetical protein Tco_0438689 [Tanacetum coccineum]